jgi:hypothetical protein
MKKCTFCQIEKEKSEFYKNLLSKDLLQSRCKKCIISISRSKEILNRRKNEDLILLDKEIFKPISFNKNYLISNLGRAYVKEHYSTKYISSKYLKLTKLTTGYSTITIDGKKYLVHRLVATEFIKKESEEKNIVNHIDSDRLNNKVENLEWCTLKENIIHGVSKDRFSHKLNRHQVLEILNNNELCTKELSIKYNVSDTNINLIKKRKIWKHI